MKKLTALALVALLSACATATYQGTKAGLVEYAGSQKTIFDTGKATASAPVAVMSSDGAVFGVAAVAGLDCEITVFNGKPYVTQVRGDAYTMDHSREHGFTFGVWTRQSKWREEAIPPEVKGYLELQNYVKTRAAAAGIDVTKPFPFQLSGTPAEVKWHINVDRTEGKAVTSELFAKSKANYVAKNQPMDIIGFYSETHPGVFISAYAPAIPKESGLKNAIHIHMLSRDEKSAGHIDNLTLAPGMVLRLPQM